jgi:hypothetical protein
VWDAQRSPSALARAGLAVDTTCGFHDAQGFRAGLAWPYRLWDAQADTPCEVVEIPLIFMDAVGDVCDERTWAELYGLLERAQAVGGSVAVLCHVDCFLGHAAATERYRGLLAWLRQRGAVLNADCPRLPGIDCPRDGDCPPAPAGGPLERL